MTSQDTSLVRICEWSRVMVPQVDRDARFDVSSAVERWRQANELSTLPLTFAGPDGSELCATQHVGVVEVNGLSIEIYPKLDAEFVSHDDRMPLPSPSRVDNVMRNLLWMLEVADYRDIAEADLAHLDEVPTSFIDLFAYLLGRNLLPELERGVAHSYVQHRGDRQSVRGRIYLRDQVTRNWNRFDRLSCTWDEFTPDIPLNRVFKCACRFLSSRSSYPEAVRLLRDCQLLLSDVDDVPPNVALADSRARAIWDSRCNQVLGKIPARVRAIAPGNSEGWSQNEATLHLY